jgi:hypothetical protein
MLLQYMNNVAFLAHLLCGHRASTTATGRAQIINDFCGRDFGGAEANGDTDSCFMTFPNSAWMRLETS